MHHLTESQRSAVSAAPSARRIDLNLLIGLSWMGEATTKQISRIWSPQRTLRAAQHRLHKLKDMGMVQVRYDYTMEPHAQSPRRTAAAWSLTDAGFALVEREDPTIGTYLPPRHQTLMEHDLFTSEVVTRVIELGRPVGLSGLMVYRESRLDPSRARPIADAFIIARFLPTDPADPYLVPWVKGHRLVEEHRRRWALENDRGTEALSILAGKAEHYKQANTLEWRSINGFFPVPLIVTPSHARMERIYDLWRQIWPRGSWLMTTDAGLQADHWQLYHNGQECVRGLFHTPLAENEAQEGEHFPTTEGEP